MAEPGERALVIDAADLADREWAARLMASSEPWITLGRTLGSCLRVCTNPEYPMFIARLGAERCGFALLNRRGVVGSPYLATLAVAAPFRGRGVGGALLQFVEDHVRPEATHLFLCVSSFNTRAQRFYARHGFVKVGELPDYFIAGASEWLMHKRLD